MAHRSSEDQEMKEDDAPILGSLSRDVLRRKAEQRDTSARRDVAFKITLDPSGGFVCIGDYADGSIAFETLSFEEAVTKAMDASKAEGLALERMVFDDFIRGTREDWYSLLVVKGRYDGTDYSM